MGVKRWLVAKRDGYVIAQARGFSLPEFESAEPVRRRILFGGRVQRVGFRLEVYELANRLELTGFCRNLESGEVLAEFQGTEARIACLVTAMESLKRIRIRRKEVTCLPLVPEETGFLKL